jgi:hypothetical protein
MHLNCKGGLTDCGPANFLGRIMRVTFPNGKPSQPQTVADGFDYPIGTTICVIGKGICPFPNKATPPPSRETASESSSS